MERIERCDRCRWWKETEGMKGGLGRGVCHRNPPTLCDLWVKRADDPEPMEDPDLWIWPATDRDDFCGEFIPRGV